MRRSTKRAIGTFWISTAIKPLGLLDTNVLISAVDAAVPGHAAVLSLLLDYPPFSWAIAAHSYAEGLNTLTRTSRGAPFKYLPLDAWRALATLKPRTLLVGLTPEQTLDAVRVYAEGGGIGPRLYDHLIGRAAVVAGIGTIVTHNGVHMRGLFPKLTVVAPIDFAA